jgi:hypothetical protein
MAAYDTMQAIRAHLPLSKPDVNINIGDKRPSQNSTEMSYYCISRRKAMVPSKRRQDESTSLLRSNRAM